MMMFAEAESSNLDLDRLSDLATAFRTASPFGAMMRTYTAALIHFRRDPRVVNKLISHSVRFRIVSHLLFLHAAKVLAGGEGGVTYGEMLDLCMQQRDIGTRVLKTTLPLMALSGFVAVARDPGDRRVKIYTPTEKLFANVRARVVPIIDALQMLQPEIPRTTLLHSDPLFLMRALWRHGKTLLEGTSPYNFASEFVDFLSSREGAAQVVYAVMLADMEAKPLPSRASIAKQFGLSKTQVWAVFTEGERLGCFINDGTAVPVATDKLREDYYQWTAFELAFSARVLAPA